MKIWIDRKGKVHSFFRGSLEQAISRMVKIIAYLQKRINEFQLLVETAAQESGTEYADTKRKHDDAIRAEYAEMGGRC